MTLWSNSTSTNWMIVTWEWRNYICFCSRRQRKLILLSFTILLLISLMIIGVLVVILTSPSSKTTCTLTFKHITEQRTIRSPQTKGVGFGDVNNDGRNDIIVTNSGKNTIGIFFGKANESFTNQTTFETGPLFSPSLIAVGDFNQDSCLDIAVAYYDVNSIGIFLGYGNGSFCDQVIISTGPSHPSFITVADCNNDRQIDLVVANYGTDSISIFLGYGNGSFQEPIAHGIGYDSLSFSLVVEDFDHDHRMDMAIANHGTSAIHILLGYGNGSFADADIYLTSPKSRPTSITVADFNHDMHPDLAVANSGTNDIFIFIGRGDGSFQHQSTYFVSYDCYLKSLTVGYFNNDIHTDLAIIDSNNDELRIFLGSGDGQFPTVATYEMVSQSEPFSIAVVDVNGNNQSDIAIANYGINNVRVLIDLFTTVAARQTTYYDGLPSRVTSVVVSDFNRDHFLDVAFNTAANIHVLYGSNDGSFEKREVHQTALLGIQYICVADLNEDEYMDIIGANRNADVLNILLSRGDGSFAPMISHPTGATTGPMGVAVGDLDGDGHLDLVSANTGTSSIGIHLGHGDGNFTAARVVSLGTTSVPYSVALGDINNDQHLDIVVADGKRLSGKIFILLGDGYGNFSLTRMIDTGRLSFSVILADFNRDTFLDVAVTNLLDGNIGVFLGYGNATFTTQMKHSIGPSSQPYHIVTADFNQDEIHDIAVGAFGDDTVVIFEGYGNGSFELKRTHSTGSGSKPYGIAVADFSGTNKLDIAAILFGTGDLVILREYYAVRFSQYSDYSTGAATQPSSIALSDLNHDNRCDIVVANAGTGDLSLIINTPTQVVDKKVTSTIITNSSPQFIITADVNRDQNVDILAVNSNEDSISVFMGCGNGSFGEKLEYSTGSKSRPLAIASGDLNNDHRMDLVIVNEEADSVGILFGYNYASFKNLGIYSQKGAVEPSSIVVGDLNRDSYLDIAFVFVQTDQLGILLGFGDGRFHDMIIYSTGTGSRPYGVIIGDFNNDEQLDIAVTLSGTGAIGIFLGYGNGTLAPMLTHSTGDRTAPSVITTGHVDQDNYLDLIVANYQSNQVQIFLGHGNGSFVMSKTYFTGYGSSPRAVASGDFNHDGFLDIVVGINNLDGIGVMLGQGDGTFANQTIFLLSKYAMPYWVTTGYLNNDDHLDIVTAHYVESKIGIFFGFGNGTFSSVRTYSTGDGSLPTCVSVGDFNKDNLSDIAVANYGTSTIMVLFGNGDGTFLKGVSYSTGTNAQTHGLAIGDFDNDNRLDVVVTTVEPSTIQIFLGSNEQPFAGITTYSTGVGSRPHSVVLGDLNDDGRLDIAVANYGTNNVGIMLQETNGTFPHLSTYSIGPGTAPRSLVLADLNNDHRLDVVVANTKADSIAILLNNGTGNFTIAATYSTGSRSSPYSIVIDDFNNDRIWDVAVANAGTNNVVIMYGYGNGTFGNESFYALGYGCEPHSIASNDLNQDEWVDIVVACHGTNSVEILMKMC